MITNRHWRPRRQRGPGLAMPVVTEVWGHFVPVPRPDRSLPERRFDQSGDRGPDYLYAFCRGCSQGLDLVFLVQPIHVDQVLLAETLARSLAYYNHTSCPPDQTIAARLSELGLSEADQLALSLRTRREHLWPLFRDGKGLIGRETPGHGGGRWRRGQGRGGPNTNEEMRRRRELKADLVLIGRALGVPADELRYFLRKPPPISLFGSDDEAQRVQRLLSRWAKSAATRQASPD